MGWYYYNTPVFSYPPGALSRLYLHTSFISIQFTKQGVYIIHIHIYSSIVQKQDAPRLYELAYIIIRDGLSHLITYIECVCVVLNIRIEYFPPIGEPYASLVSLLVQCSSILSTQHVHPHHQMGGCPCMNIRGEGYLYSQEFGLVLWVSLEMEWEHGYPLYVIAIHLFISNLINIHIISLTHLESTLNFKTHTHSMIEILQPIFISPILITHSFIHFQYQNTRSIL